MDTVESVRRRRDELDRLKLKQQMRSAQGRVQMKVSDGPRSRAPPPPGAAPIERVRHSDIFPGVDKVAKTAKEVLRGQPAPKSRMQAPPPRRLDQSFERGGASPSHTALLSRGASPGPASNRSRSAPPSRRPPPPGPPPPSQEAPDSTPSRAFAPRPPAMAAGAKNAKSKPPPIAFGPPISSIAPPPATPKAPSVPANRLATPPPPPASTPAAPPTTPQPPGNDSPTPTQTVPGSGPPTPGAAPLPPRAESAPPTPTLSQPAPPTPSGPPTMPSISVPGPSPAPAQAPAPILAISLEPEVPPKTLPASAPRVAAINETEEGAKAAPSAPLLLPHAFAVEEMETTAPATKMLDASVKPRQILIRNMHEFAETPMKTIAPMMPAQDNVSKKNETSLLRLEKEVREHERAKADALRRVVELEEEVQKLKEQGAMSQLVTETPRASTSQVGFFSPLSPGLATPTASTHKRMATPHPKYSLQSTPSAANDEEDSRSFFSDAVQCTPFEFTTELATYVVRRPYGKAKERELWFQTGYLNSKQYERTADVNKADSLEIVAQISADGSILSLHGSNFVRHRSGDCEWREFGNVDELGQPLGSITYIDSDASEKDYSLDDIFYGAELARENYCISIVSMGVGLKANEEYMRGKRSVVTAPTKAAVVANPVQKQTVEVGVGTEGLHIPTSAPAPASASGLKNSAVSEQEQPSTSPPTFEDEGSDTVSLFVGAFGSLLVWMFKAVLVTFPLTVLSFGFAMLLFFAAICLISLQLTDFNGAVGMGAKIDTMFNSPGIV